MLLIEVISGGSERSRPCPPVYLYAQTGLHQMELVHQLLVQRSHVLRNKLLVHGEAVLQDMCLQDKVKFHVPQSWSLIVYFYS